MNPTGWPAAYLITFTTYGSWLHGRKQGSVDRNHNQYGAPVLAGRPPLHRACARTMSQPAFRLDEDDREAVRSAVVGVFAHRRWTLHALHVRSSHLHAVVSAACRPERVVRDFKGWASRGQRRTGEPSGRRFWTRGHSSRYLWNESAARRAVEYVLHEQGPPMAVWPPPTEPFT